MKLKFLYLILCATFLFSCSLDDDNQDCTDLVVITNSLETQYGCTNTPFQIDINLTEDFTVISSQQEYDDLVTGTCDVDIDFAVYDLVIGKKGLPNGVEVINYRLIQNCDTDILYLEVLITTDATAIAPNITYHRLIPKLSASQEVSVEVIVQ